MFSSKPHSLSLTGFLCSSSYTEPKLLILQLWLDMKKESYPSVSVSDEGCIVFVVLALSK